MEERGNSDTRGVLVRDGEALLGVGVENKQKERIGIATTQRQQTHTRQRVRFDSRNSCF